MSVESVRLRRTNSTLEVAIASEHRMLARYRRRYGDVFALDMWPFDPLVVVSDPEEVKRIFTGDPAQLTPGRATRCSGRSWARTRSWCSTRRRTCAPRKMLLPPFHGERMRVYGDVMRELATAEVESWPLGTELELLPAMQRLTLRIILRTVFGLEEGAKMAELKRALVRSWRAARGSCWSRCCSATSGR